MFSVSRIVTLLTPVFGAVAAAGMGWLARHAPGLPVPSTAQITALEIAGFTGAVGMAAHWLHGHQAFEKRLAEIAPLQVLGEIGKTVKKLDPKLTGEVETIVNAEISKALGRIVTQQATAAPATSPGASAAAGLGG